MPQLDPSSYSSQLFWLTVSFIVLYVLLARMLLPRVQSVLGQRAEVIGTDIEEAKRMKADAELAKEHYEKALKQARTRSQALLLETQLDIASRSLIRQAELDTQVEKKLAESQAAIQSATKDVMGKLAAVTADLTSAISQAVANYKPEAGKVETMVGAVMKKQGA